MQMNPNAEFYTLAAHEQEAVRRVVRRFRAEGGTPTEILDDGNDVYATAAGKGLPGA